MPLDSTFNLYLLEGGLFSYTLSSKTIHGFLSPPVQYLIRFESHLFHINWSYMICTISYTRIFPVSIGHILFCTLICSVSIGQILFCSLIYSVSIGTILYTHLFCSNWSYPILYTHLLCFNWSYPILYTHLFRFNWSYPILYTHLFRFNWSYCILFGTLICSVSNGHIQFFVHLVALF